MKQDNTQIETQLLETVKTYNDNVAIIGKNLIHKQKLEKQRFQTELKIKAEVASEKDEAGKNKFSNETLRSAETEKRLKEDSEYQKTMTAIEDIEFEVANCRIVQECASELTKSLRAILYGRGGF